jgi:hypothetical protein
VSGTKATGSTFLRLSVPSGRFSWTRRCCPVQGSPTGITILPPGLSCSTRGDVHGRGRDDDAVERGVLRPAEIAVANPDRHVPITEPLQGSPGVVAELRHDLGRVDVIDRVWVA